QGVDLFESKLTGEDDRLVQARFTLCDGSFVSQRIALLVPLGEGKACRLAGDELSVDQATRSLPCGQKRLPRVLDFADGVLKVDDRTGFCNGREQSGDGKLTLYDVQGA